MIEKMVNNKYISGLMTAGLFALVGLAYTYSNEINTYLKPKQEETKKVRQYNKYQKEFTLNANDVYEQTVNLVQLHQKREYVDLGLLTELKNVFADGNSEVVMSKKVEDDLDYMVNETTMVGKLLRPYTGLQPAPIPTVGEKKTFDEMFYQNKRWSGVIRELIDTNDDRKYSEQELNEAIYKVLHQ